MYKIGNVYKQLKDYNRALINFKGALKLYKVTPLSNNKDDNENVSKNILKIEKSIAEVYLLKNDKKKALKIIKKNLVKLMNKYGPESKKTKQNLQKLYNNSKT